VAGWVLAGSALAAGPAAAQGMATADRIQSPGWWPTKGTAARREYVGPAACLRCHRGPAAGQPATAMALTARRAEESDVLRAHPDLTHEAGRFRYQIARSEGQSVYSVSDGSRSLSAALGWAFGVGRVGQTYLFERGGAFFEARVSYFDAIGGLGFTPSHSVSAPRDVEEAMARAVDAAEARRCFGCHTTASTTQGTLDLARLIPGITCEVCHGPGAAHVAAIEGDRLAEGRRAILNPRSLDPSASVDFCGACHATWWDVTLAHETGPAALRSQPYRLQGSRCWGQGDARLTCVACHDAHQPRATDPLSYDGRCLACHVTSGSAATPPRRAAACTVATQGCVTCHMPKYEVPGMHARFTDHQIRVVERPSGRPSGP